jgi:hypothetical protein
MIGESLVFASLCVIVICTEMGNHYERFAKRLIATMLSPYGHVETDVGGDEGERSAVAGLVGDQKSSLGSQGIVARYNEAVKEGFRQGQKWVLVEIYEARFGAMPGELRAAIEATHDEAMLRSWIKLAGTRSADELAAAIRATRAS